MPIRENPRVFISYARSDGKDFALTLRRRLTNEHGLAVWQDLVEMEGGRNWWQQIEAAIRHPDLEYLVLVITANSLHSNIVREEWRLARQEGKCVVPVIGADAVKSQISSLPQWMRAAHFVDPDEPEQWIRFVRTLESPCTQMRVPKMAPPPPTDFIARWDEFEELKNILLSQSQEQCAPIIAGLKGAGGYGKTVLAKAICHDDAIQQRFYHGILWVTLGETPDLIKLTLDLIEVLSGIRPGYQELSAAGARLGELLTGHAYLIAVDDVWKRSHLETLLQCGPSCGWLVTTRNSNTLPQDSPRVTVDAMKKNEAISLLCTGLPEGESQRLDALTAQLGEWPLLLKLANGVLTQRIASKQPLHAALDYMEKALNKRGLTAFDIKHETDRNRAAEKSLAVSMELLTSDQKERIAELSIFPEDTDIPLSIVELLWKQTAGLDDIDTEEVCDHLFQLSLLLDLNLAARTLRLHDVIRSLLERNNRTKTRAWHTQLLNGVDVANWTSFPQELHYFWRGLAYHLQQAGRETELRTLLFNLDWLREKLNASGINGLLSDFDFLQNEPGVMQIRRALSTAAHILTHEPQQLPMQLLARLTPDCGDISELLNKASAAPSGVWLRPRVPTLIDDPALLRTLEGHRFQVNAVAITPDGKRAVSGSYDLTLRVWELDTGVLLRTVACSHPITAVAVTLDGKCAVSSGGDDLFMWNLDTGALLRQFDGHTSGVDAVALLADGKRIVSGSCDKTLKVWDLETGTLLRTLQTDGEVTSVATAPDGKRAASGSKDKTLKVWDLDSGVLLYKLAGHLGTVGTVAISPDCTVVVSGSEDHTIKVWAMDTGTLLHTLEGHLYSVSGIAITADGRCAVSGSLDATIKVWDLKTGILLRTLEGQASSVTGIAATIDGRLVVSISEEGPLKLWDLSNAENPNISKWHALPITGVAISPLGKHAVSGSFDTTLKIWELDSGALLHTLEGHKEEVTALAITSDAKRAVSASQDATLKVWELDTGTMLHTLRGHEHGVTAVAIAPDGKYVISGSEDASLRVWGLDTGALLLTLKGHEGQITAVAITSDGKLAVSGSADAMIKVWELETGTLIHTFEHLEESRSADDRWYYEVTALAITPDGKRAVTGSYEGYTHYVWDLNTGALTHSLKIDRHIVTAAAITLDGSRVVFGSKDCTISVWDLGSGALVYCLEGHLDTVNAVAITPDGNHALSGSDDHTIKMWNLKSGLLTASWSADARITHCAIAPNGRTIFVGDVSGRVHFLEIVEIV